MSALTNEARERLTTLDPNMAHWIRGSIVSALLADLADAEAVAEVEHKARVHYRAKTIQFQEEADALRAQVATLREIIQRAVLWFDTPERWERIHDLLVHALRDTNMNPEAVAERAALASTAPEQAAQEGGE